MIPILVIFQLLRVFVFLTGVAALLSIAFKMDSFSSSLLLLDWQYIALLSIAALHIAEVIICYFPNKNKIKSLNSILNKELGELLKKNGIVDISNATNIPNAFKVSYMSTADDLYYFPYTSSDSCIINIHLKKNNAYLFFLPDCYYDLPSEEAVRIVSRVIRRIIEESPELLKNTTQTKHPTTDLSITSNFERFVKEQKLAERKWLKKILFD